MFGAVYTAPGLPGLRLLQRTPDHFGESRRIVHFESAGLVPLALFLFMRIAVDVMGGDHGCDVVIDGIKLALNALPGITELHVVGDQKMIEAAMVRSKLKDPRVRIVHASEVLTMEDKPLVAVRKKRDSSIVRAAELVKEGKAEALISPGNTGGVVTAATLTIGRLEGVERPAIATVVPAGKAEFILIDAGANPEGKPLHLVQFAGLG